MPGENGRHHRSTPEGGGRQSRSSAAAGPAEASGLGEPAACACGAGSLGAEVASAASSAATLAFLAGGGVPSCGRWRLEQGADAGGESTEELAHAVAPTSLPRSSFSGRMPAGPLRRTPKTELCLNRGGGGPSCLYELCPHTLA